MISERAVKLAGTTYRAMSIRTVGIDIGTGSTVVVADDGDLVLTSTGSISRASSAAFYGRTRMVGEESVPHAASPDTVNSLNLFISQKTVEELNASTLAVHRNNRISSDDLLRLDVEVNYNDELQKKAITAVLGMYLAKEVARIDEVYACDSKVKLAFALPPNATATMARTIREACIVGGVDVARVCTISKTDALVAAYARKLKGLLETERKHLENKKTLIVEVGASQTTAVVISTNTLVEEKGKEGTAQGPEALATEYNDDCGCKHFDSAIFTDFSARVKDKHKEEPRAGTKRGFRVMGGAERIRKLLSGITEANIQVESVSDMGDMAFTLTRDAMSRLAAKPLRDIKILLEKVLVSAGITATDIHAIEITGGGVRMQVVQAIILDMFSGSIGTGTNALGAKLDDGSVALGAALVCNKLYADDVEVSEPVPDSPYVPLGMPTSALITPNTKGYTDGELAVMREQELAMQEQDKKIVILLAKRNEMESYLLECRQYPGQKYGDTIPALKLEDCLNEYEGWMWDFPEAGLEETESKYNSLVAAVQELCKDFLALKEDEGRRVEAELEKAAQEAQDAKMASGEDDDHDNRKLKKADRMRLVTKNKEEGTEIFKGGVWRTAAARYHKALTHCSKFFDLTPADEEEVRGIKTSLYLNLAQCYLKMEQPDHAINQCTLALECDPRSAKAYYRRAMARESKKLYEEALEDATNAQAEMVVPDKGVNALVQKLKKILAAEKKKEKEAWAGAFGGGGGKSGAKKKGKGK